MTENETSKITGNLVSNMATRIFFQAAENTAAGGGEIGVSPSKAENLDNAAPNSIIDDEEKEEDGEIYEVERILQDKIKRGKRLFLVRWKGYDENEDSWEPEENLEGAREVLKAYLANLENQKSHKAQKTKRSSLNYLKSNAKRKPFNEHSEDEKSANNSDDNFSAPKKKKSRKSEPKNKNSETVSAASAQTTVEKAIARRKNLSNSMRWISDSSDESDEDLPLKIKSCNGSLTPEMKASSFSIHPDSSTDIGLKSGETNNATVTDCSYTAEPAATTLKLKITKFSNENNCDVDGQTPNRTSTVSEGILKHDSSNKTSSSKLSKNKSLKKIKIRCDATPTNIKSSLTFTGVYLNESRELRYVAVDDKTQKHEIYALGEAFVVDGWSLCRFLASKVIFATDGSVEIPGNCEAGATK